MADMKFHPIAAVFPLLEGAELEALTEDIREHGLLEPARLYEGKILDGRNRATACKAAGVKLQTKEFKGTHLEALAFVWSYNRTRRHLNSSQTAIAEVKRAKLEEEYGAKVAAIKETAKSRRAQGKGKLRGQKASAPQLIGEQNSHEKETTSKRAKSSGTNRAYIADAEKIVKSHPKKADEILRGEKTIPQVKREIKKAEVAKKLAELPDDKFRVFYADPPWNYGNSGSGIDQYGPAERHYPSMTIADLCAMDIKSIATKNAVLFLWVTSPLLAECWPVIRAWGFDYKTSFVWDKIKHNFGHYNSVRHELLLVCTRGSCTPEVGKLFDSVVSVERGKHSEKPEEFRKIIQTLYPTGKRIELFARKNAKGWSAYGNEA